MAKLLDYAPPQGQPTPRVSPTRLGAAFVLWSLPIPLGILAVRHPVSIKAGLVIAPLGLPFVAACVLAGLGILPQGSRWRWFWCGTLPVMGIIGWLAYTALAAIDMD
jgi:hypothetical protein